MDSVVLEGSLLLWTVLVYEAADSVWVHLDTTDWGGVWGSSEHPTKNKHIKHTQQCVNAIFILDQKDMKRSTVTSFIKDNEEFGFRI